MVTLKECLNVSRWTVERDEPVILPWGKPIPVSVRGFMSAVELRHLNQASLSLLQKGVPGGVLEVGSYCGLSACALGQPGPLTCVDTFSDSWGPTESERYTREEFDSNMKMMGLSPRVFEADSKKILPQLRQEGEKFRLILIDGGHSYKEAHIDLMNAKPLVSPGGVIIVDDADVPEVMRAIVDAGIQGVMGKSGKLYFGVP